MIRVSEAVLPGHPDKLCDHVAASIVQAALAVDAGAYAQIEAGIWCDQLWLSGSYALDGPPIDVEGVARRALAETAAAVDPGRAEQVWQITNAVCRRTEDAANWVGQVSDQAIVIGWAGYDERLDYLPPEHWLVLQFRDALWQACQGGLLARCGPDGKLLVRIREDAEGFAVEHVLVTLQHPAEVDVIRLGGLVTDVLREHYARLQARDRRWWRPWEQVEALVNPAGPLVDGGSRGDNGQTGRKLVMDYYGPRVPIGGGALYGKHPGHIDRFGATRARELAVEAVRRGAGECTVRACYAPSVPEPIDVSVEVLRRDGQIDRGRLVMTAGQSSADIWGDVSRLPVASGFSVLKYGLESNP